MSNTDKDEPWYVRAEWFEPSHGIRCEFAPEPIFRRRYRDGFRPCNLPPEPVRGNYSHGSRPGWRIRYETGDPCIWEPIWPRQDRYNYTWPPSREDRHFGWWGPDRAEVRDLMVAARKEWNGSRDTDVDEPTRTHRHGPRSGGWWD